MKPIKLAAVLFFLPVAHSAWGEVYPLTEHSFSNPEFRQRFVESYLAESEVNPRVTPDEKALFDEIVPLIQSAPKDAIARLQTAVKPENSAAFDFILGNLLYQEDDLAGSVVAYDKAIKKFPSYFRAYYNAGRALVADGKYAEALPRLQKALEIQPGDGALYGLVGYCYINLEQPSTALDAYRIAVMLAPKSRDWRLGKLQCHVALGQAEDAIGILYEFIAKEPENADWWKLQANQFMSQNKVKEAAANLTVVKDMGKADGSSLSLLGDLLLNEGLVGPALESYLAAMNYKLSRPRRMFEVADSLAQLGKVAEARTLVAKVESALAAEFEEPQQMALLNLKARLALADQNSEEAAGYLERVVGRDPMNGSALLTLAELERSRDDLAKAAFYAENASKLDPFAHRAFLMLAQMRVAQRDYQEAAKFLRRAQQIEPKDYVADYLLRIEQAALRL